MHPHIKFSVTTRESIKAGKVSITSSTYEWGMKPRQRCLGVAHKTTGKDTAVLDYQLMIAQWVGSGESIYLKGWDIFSSIEVQTSCWGKLPNARTAIFESRAERDKKQAGEEQTSDEQEEGGCKITGRASSREEMMRQEWRGPKCRCLPCGVGGGTAPGLFWSLLNRWKWAARHSHAALTASQNHQLHQQPSLH